MMSKGRLASFVGVVLVCLVCVPMVGMEGMGRGASAQTPFSCADVTEIPTSECEALVTFCYRADC